MLNFMSSMNKKNKAMSLMLHTYCVLKQFIYLVVYAVTTAIDYSIS